MTLESKIQQAKFKTPQHKLGVNLLYTSHLISYLLHQQFKDLEITHQQYNVLRILRGQHPKPCNLKLIKERIIDRMSDASRIIDKLIVKAFVERKECSSDRRNVDLLITEKGLKLLASLDHVDGSFHDRSRTSAKMISKP
ncbi:MAG: MarR family transcriptional regulator [Sphingobacteriaceae bacterium]|nr:MarR family transcriptional regulator [Sphingobacteriaceae bacterium]